MLSNQHGVVATGLLALLNLSLLLRNAEAQPSLPLELSYQQFDPERAQVEFVLTNTGEEPIVAWGLHVHYVHDDGKLTELSFLQDFEGSESEPSPGVEEDDHLAGALLPKQSHRDTLVVPEDRDSPVSTVSLFVRLVVFSGGESLGDESLHREILVSRRASRLAESYWLAQFRRALSQSRSEEDLALRMKDLLERLGSGSEIYSGDGITSTDASARSREQVLRRDLESVIDEASQPGSSQDLWGLFADLVERMEQRQAQRRPVEVR